MRTRHFREGSAWAVNLGTAPEITPNDEPTRGAIIHLLRARKGGMDSLFGKVLTCLEAVGSDEPNGSDITWLRQRGYIKWQSGYDTLLPLGLHKVERIAKDMARTYGLHHITHKAAGRRQSCGPTVSCTCGWNTIASKSNPASLARHAADHMALVNSGSYRAPRPVHEFLNQYDPPSFDFNSGPPVSLPPACPGPDDARRTKHA